MAASLNWGLWVQYSAAEYSAIRPRREAEYSVFGQITIRYISSFKISGKKFDSEHLWCKQEYGFKPGRNGYSIFLGFIKNPISAAYRRGVAPCKILNALLHMKEPSFMVKNIDYHR